MLTITTRFHTARQRLALLLMALGLGIAPAAAQDSGRILGRVTDAATDEGLVGAQVVLPATDAGAITGEDGRFAMTGVPAGTHTLRVFMLGYGESELPVTVRAGQTAMAVFAVESRAIELEAITVEAAIERGSSIAVITERRNAAQVVDAIGAEQIARSSDGDAAAVASRSPGVTVVGGRYVYVRGLGERYGSATLNDAPLASPEPDRKVVPLDLIPSSFLESVVTAKTYSADQPGDYAGGLVQLRTRSYPPFGLFRITGSSTWDTQSAFAPGLTYDGGGLDALGLDDGTRGLPAFVVPDQAVTQRNYSPGQLEQIGESLYPVWAPEAEDLPLNQSLSVLVGDEWRIGRAERPLGFLATGSYSNGYRHRPDEIERVFTSALLAEPRVDYVGRTTTHSVGVGGMLQLAYEPAAGHKLSLSSVFNRSTDDQARILEGFNDDIDASQRNYRLQYLAQSVYSGQLRGEHYLPSLGDTRVAWRGDLRTAARYEPNTRELVYAEGPDGVYRFENFISSGSVFHQDLGELGWGGALDVTVPFSVRGRDASLHVGGLADLRTRDVYTRRLRFINTSLDQGTRELGPNEILSAATIAPDSFQIQEATFPGDNYGAEQDVLAGFAMLDVAPFQRLRVSAGARLEAATQRVDPRVMFADSLNRLPGALLDDTDVLPALNLTYALTSAMNLRIGASQTLARPQFRELAPFGYADYSGGYYVRGNPLLRRSRIRNYDVRWEWFPGLDGVIAVSGFYKEFDDPIEVLVFQTGGEIGKTWFNAAGADNYGVELEARSSLGFVSPALETLSLNANLTLVESTVRTDEDVLVALGTGDTTAFVLDASERPLQGLSPYVVNLGASWSHPTWGTTASVLYNRFGERVESVGMQPLPSIHESARNSLDLVLQQRVGGQWTLKLAAERVLGSEIEYTQGGALLRSWDLGRSYTLSVSWGGEQ